MLIRLIIRDPVWFLCVCIFVVVVRCLNRYWQHVSGVQMLSVRCARMLGLMETDGVVCVCVCVW